MVELAPFSLPGRFLRGNMHTHSTRSDGSLSPEAVCMHYRDAGYDFLALTDHFLDRFGFPVTDTRPFATKGFTTIPSAEVHAPATKLGELWHIVAVGLPLGFEATPPEETGPQLAARAAAAGAFIGIAHPQWYGLDADDADTIACAHAVEVYNHNSQVRSDRGDGWYLLDALTERGRTLGAYACDDAHFHVKDACGGWVQVKAESREPEAIVAALKAGHYYASQGPQIHEVSIEGEEIRLVTTPVVTALVLGRGSRMSRHEGREVTRVSLPVGRFRGSWARVAAIDAFGRRAWTSPFRVDG